MNTVEEEKERDYVVGMTVQECRGVKFRSPQKIFARETESGTRIQKIWDGSLLKYLVPIDR